MMNLSIFRKRPIVKFSTLLVPERWSTDLARLGSTNSVSFPQSLAISSTLRRWWMITLSHWRCNAGTASSGAATPRRPWAPTTINSRRSFTDHQTLHLIAPLKTISNYLLSIQSQELGVNISPSNRRIKHANCRARKRNNGRSCG